MSQLPEPVHQAIEQIISKTDGVTPDLRQHLYAELQEQFQQIVTQTALAHLDGQPAETFNTLLNQQPGPDPDRIQEFLMQHFPVIDPILNEAITTLKKQYLEE